MLTVVKRRYKKQYVIGGSGIFSSVVGFFKKLFTSNAAKKVATSLASSAAKQVGKHMTNKLLEAPPASATTPAITQTSRDNLARMMNEATPRDINNLMMHGSGIAIQDLVRKINGRGMKIVK
jgi:hypothetical protein